MPLENQSNSPYAFSKWKQPSQTKESCGCWQLGSSPYLYYAGVSESIVDIAPWLGTMLALRLRTNGRYRIDRQ